MALPRFAEIEARAAKRKGGKAALAALMPQPKSPRALAAIPDDRWLSQMTRCVFYAGFSWSVIDAKWEDFEVAFEGFSPARWRMMGDDDLDRLLKDARIVRNGAKIRSVARNAALLWDLAQEHGSAAKVFAKWPAADLVGLFDLLKTRGDRLGGATGQLFLRFMGKDGFVLSQDVVRALQQAKVISGPATSKTAQKAVQAAFNAWAEESGRPLMHISRTLALSVD